MLISHCHVKAQPFGEDKVNEGAGLIETLLGIMDRVGVERAVCFAPFGPQTDAQVEANRWLLEAIAPHPRLVGFATVDPKSEGAGERLRELVAQGMRGAKYHPAVMQTAIDDPACADYWQAVHDMRLPVHVHTGVHGWRLRHYQPLLLDEVCKTWPDVRVIIDHMGGVAFFTQALAVLHDNPGAYAGLTQMSGRGNKYALTDDHRRLLIETARPDHIVYGYDYPWNYDNVTALRQDIHWVGQWGLGAAEAGLIFGGNMERLLGEVRPPAA